MPGIFRFEVCPECCECLYAEDKFDRPDSEDPGAGWSEVAGDADIFGNTLLVTGNAVIVYGIEMASTNMIVSVRVYDEQEDEKYDVIVNYQDAQNYYYARYYTGKPSAQPPLPATISLNRVQGGADGMLATENVVPAAPPEDQRYMYVVFCKSGGDVPVQAQFCAWVTEATHYRIWEEVTPFSAGRKAGLGGNNTGGVRFNDFELIHCKRLKDQLTCMTCACRCQTNALNKTLTVTITGTGRCSCASAEWTLTWNKTSLLWEGQGTVCGSTLQTTLTCSSPYDPDDITLTINSCTALDGTFKYGSGTCDPLSLTFTWSVAAYDFACVCYPDGTGTLTFTVTE